MFDVCEWASLNTGGIWTEGDCVPTYYAEELTAPEFAGFVTEHTIGVLPVAAIEPHGPHLPLSTDCDIARGHLAHLSEYVAEDTDVLILPLQAIGLSVEHAGFAGLFSHSPDILLRTWTDVAKVFYAAGGRRLIIVSSHGGNSEIVGLLIGSLRAELGMLAVSAAIPSRKPCVMVSSPAAVPSDAASTLRLMLSVIAALTKLSIVGIECSKISRSKMVIAASLRGTRTMAYRTNG